METAYIPQASVKEKKEMTLHWTQTSKNLSLFCFVLTVISLISATYFLKLSAAHILAFGIVAVLFLISGLLCRKWKLFGYILHIFSVILYILSGISGIPLLPTASIGGVAAGAVAGCVSLYFCAKCLYNYKSVFLQLKKERGFPDFIVNSADLYADKLYLRNKDKTVNQALNEVSYNPFNTKSDIKNEELQRSQNLKVSSSQKPLVMDIDENSALHISHKTESTSYEHGFSIFGIEIIFHHNDIPTSSLYEKKELMNKWNIMAQRPGKNFAMVFFLMLIASVMSIFSGSGGLFTIIFIPIYIIGINYIKMGNIIGPVITLITAPVHILSVLSSSGNIFSVAFIIGAYIFGIFSIISSIQFLLNYKIYKALSKEKGFPSFAMNSADLYAEQYYLKNEKSGESGKTATNTHTRQNEPIVMNIGYDKKPPEKDEAWNPFAYLDKTEENTTDIKNEENTTNGKEE